MRILKLLCIPEAQAPKISWLKENVPFTSNATVRRSKLLKRLLHSKSCYKNCKYGVQLIIILKLRANAAANIAREQVRKGNPDVLEFFHGDDPKTIAAVRKVYEKITRATDVNSKNKATFNCQGDSENCVPFTSPSGDAGTTWSYKSDEKIYLCPAWFKNPLDGVYLWNGYQGVVLLHGYSTLRQSKLANSITNLFKFNTN